MADIEHIVAQAGHYLQAQGWLLVEHGYDQAQRVRDLFTQRGFVQVETRRDLGGNERITLGRKSQE